MRINKNLLIFTLLTVIPMLIGLASFSNEVFAADSFTDNVSLTIPVSCSMGGTVNTEHTASLQNGTYSASTGSDYENGIGKTTLTVFCNDNNGFSVYVVGYTGDIDHGDNINKLVGQNTGSLINTKVYSSGDTTSNWSMKVNKVTDSTISYLPNNMTITNSYDNWHIVPNTYDQVLTYKAETGSSATDTTLGAKLETTYAAYISSTQPADTYQGKVKYVLVNPYNATAPEPAFMQNATATSLAEAIPNSGDSITLPDERDNEEYTITNIGGTYWMTDNLRITGTLSADLSNFTGEDVNISAGSLTSGDSYTEARTAYDSAHPEYGAYYNYCAASAGTVCNDTAIANADVDVCPSGWRLPSLSEMQTISVTNGVNWNPVTSGAFYEGDISYSGESGHWWSATATDSAEEQYYLEYGLHGEDEDWDTYSDSRTMGASIRCVFNDIYNVQYDGNGADNNTGMGTTNVTTGLKSVRHTDVREGDTFDLFASNFRRAGYGFVGWSIDQNAWSKLTDNDPANDAKIWGPNEIFVAPIYNGNITTLYAIWAPAEKDANNNPVFLQGWAGCPAMTATTYDDSTGALTVTRDSITALTDERDGNVYAVAKLADGNCWMIENLRLADTHEENGDAVATILTTSNTNILATNNTLPITNVYNIDNSLAIKSNSLSPSSSQYIADDANYGWCNTSSAACFDQSRLNTVNTIANIVPSKIQNVTSSDAHADFDDVIYSYGNYYNWYSATAGYGTHSVDASIQTDGDLCPSGWRLPYGGSGSSGNDMGNTKGGFFYLLNQIGFSKIRSFPNNFVYSGYWIGWSGQSAALDRGYGGYYWSASAVNSNNAYYMILEANNSYGSPSYSKDNGLSVRCVSKL